MRRDGRRRRRPDEIEFRESVRESSSTGSHGAIVTTFILIFILAITLGEIRIRGRGLSDEYFMWL